MGYFAIIGIVATVLCSLVAGLLFAFAVVVMPGIARLSDREFIRAFQGIDGVIQDNQPLFMLVWIGSPISLLVATGLGFFKLAGAQQALIVLAAALYLLLVQMPTIMINIPLNNRLQEFDIATANDDEVSEARDAFEHQWNRWNVIRTIAAIITSVLLMVSQAGN
ncbi:MAG: anthrone oxygenase family protein [Planctomycetota bacterium]